MLYLKVHPSFHFKKHQKLQKSAKKKDIFHVADDGPVDGEVRDVPLNLKSSSLRILHILYSAEQAELLSFSN